MRSGLLTLLLLCLPAPALAGDGTVGLMLGAGVPEGAQAALVVRPTPRLRIHAGGGHNGVSPGLRAGASLAAFPFWITPVVSAEAGRFFRGDANALVSKVVGDPDLDEPLLREFGYDFASAQVGLEIGYARATFYLHAGVGAAQTRIRGLQAKIDEQRGGEMEGPTVEVRRDPLVRVIGPSARTGMVIYF